MSHCNACNGTGSIEGIACPYCKNRRPKKNKYNASPVFAHGIRFDSRAEEARYEELLLLKASGAIREIEVHPRYTLQEAFTTRSGERVRAITYSADFAYVETETGMKVVEDVKGGKATQTQAFILKAKLFKKRFPELDFRVVTKG